MKVELVRDDDSLSHYFRRRSLIAQTESYSESNRTRLSLTTIIIIIHSHSVVCNIIIIYKLDT